VPGEEEIAGEEAGMTVEDSIEAVNWLEAEKAKLAERTNELDAREKQLNVLDSKVSQKITRLEQAESARISKLAKLYDGMEARSVARLIANLDDDTVVALLPRMKLKNASSVLALMPPVRAARLSKQMITIAEN
jgi:flagellar motility protein MotE (MotC chaperone)